MVEKIISQKEVDGIVAVIDKIKTKETSYKQSIVGEYEFTFKKNNGTIEMNVCRNGKSYEDTGFSDRKVSSDITTPEVYKMINDMVYEATYDGLTVTNWN